MIIILYSLTLFLAAFLLFWVQPVIAKMILPLLGGVPAVWNTCMMFFQGILLLGYGYAYLNSRYFTRWQPIFHIGLMLVAFLFLPFQLHWQIQWLGNPPLQHNPVLWLIFLLILVIGMPLFVIATTAPLLQFWFSKTKQVAAKDPYFLYSASNAGSMLALLVYPFLLEPHLGLVQQSELWSFSFGLLVILIICCVFIARKSFRLSSTPQITATTELLIPNCIIRLRWILLSFVPSSLLLSTTTILTTNISAVPLFWIIPLTLYILTFILVFAKHTWISQSFMLRLQPFILIPLLTLPVLQAVIPQAVIIWIIFIIYLAVFFVTAMICHGELVRLRPSVNFLTEFYLWIAVGGLLGSVFNVLIAPTIFKNFVEYPLILGIAYILRPDVSFKWNRSDFLWLGILIVALAGLIHFNGISNLLYTILVILIFLTVTRPLQFGIAIGLLLLFMQTYSTLNDKIIFQERNFFGIVKVTDSLSSPARFLVHGNIIHGIQVRAANPRFNILTYYQPLRPIFTDFAQRFPKLQIAIAGLGTGTIACLTRPQDKVTFYEIDPKIVNIARQYFTFLPQCAPQATVVLGDARLSLAKANNDFYQIIILDAFSSDAIPVHLLTTEAVQLYLQKLTPQGILLFNISNRYLNLAPMLSVLAAKEKLQVLIYQDNTKNQKFVFPSTWIIFARNDTNLLNLKKLGWQSLNTSGKIHAWNDNFSNILSVIR